MLQNMVPIYVYENQKTKFLFLVFIACHFILFPNEWTGLGNSLGKNNVLGAGARNEKQK